MEPRKAPLVVYKAPDELRHFSKDGPWFRAFALVVCKLPRIVAPLCGVATVALIIWARSRGWW